MAAGSQRVIMLRSGAVPENTLEVFSFQGNEAISRVFRFDLELLSLRKDLDLDALLEQPVTLGVKQFVQLSGGERGTQTLKIHGVLSTIQQLEQNLQWTRYRAVLVPRLWRLSLYMKCRIFIDKTIPEILEEILKDAGLHKGDDFEIETTARTYPKREYVVQYQESDLNFLQRWCEHEGIFFWFEHAEEAEKLHFCDSPTALRPVQGNATIPYRAAGMDAAGAGSDWFRAESIQTLTCRQNVIPAEVVLRDYNWRTPSVSLKCKMPVDSRAAFGASYEFGHHYKNPDEGKDYARVRAEEILCRKKVFDGSGDAKGFRAGMKFTLSEYYRPDFNVEYLITELLHGGRQPLEHVTGMGGPQTYRNDFTAIPASMPYRPERVTPKPTVAGVLTARIDGAGSGDYAEIDDMGRYKVQLPFDLSGRGGGAASRFIRMAQLSAGPNEGMHFPLRKGTEVLLIHQNGDPDRPIIIGAVPNPETASPVVGGASHKWCMKTHSNVFFTIENLAGNERSTLSTPDGTFFNIGKPH